MKTFTWSKGQGPPWVTFDPVKTINMTEIKHHTDCYICKLLQKTVSNMHRKTSHFPPFFILFIAPKSGKIPQK